MTRNLALLSMVFLCLVLPTPSSAQEAPASAGLKAEQSSPDRYPYVVQTCGDIPCQRKDSG